MQSDEKTVDGYIASLPEPRREAMQKLREVILRNLPDGFEEAMGYGMMGYEVPHSLYPAGYHCDSKTPLPFMALASQKNFISCYHMGVYADQDLYNWFVDEYPKHCRTKLDIGKSCIRFKKMDDIPFELIGQLAGKMKPEDWITLYEANLKR